MSANGISTLSTKQLKQNAKLNAAVTKRATDGRLYGLDKTLLPTVYTNNVVTTQSHPSGLVIGRPWTESYSIVTSGLLLQLDAGDSASYPGSGTTWTDLSTYQNDATLTNGPSFISSGSASYLSFNGTNQFAPVTTSKMNVTYTGKTTMFAIKTVNANTGDGIYRNLFGGSTAARNFNTYMYHISGTTWRLHFSTGPTSPWAYSASASFTVTDNQWIVVAATQTTGGVVTYYVNGQQIGTPNTGVTFYQFINSGIEAVARSDNYWRGDIGAVAIYGQALNATQIQQNFNALRSRYGL
jgi:Concanavalin A-like lectin/glucanases superfamily